MVPFFIYYFFSRISSTQLITAIVEGNPIVGIASNTVCLISSLLSPTCKAFRVCEWIAPSNPAPVEIASFISDLVLSSRSYLAEYKRLKSHIKVCILKTVN